MLRWPSKIKSTVILSLATSFASTSDPENDALDVVGSELLVGHRRLEAGTCC